MKKSASKKEKERRALRMIVLVTQIGICMLVPVFFCVFIGQYISETMDMPLLFPFCLLLGILAGFRSCYQMIRRFTDLGKSGNSRRIEHWEKKEESDQDEMVKMDEGDK